MQLLHVDRLERRSGDEDLCEDAQGHDCDAEVGGFGEDEDEVEVFELSEKGVRAFRARR